MLNNVVEPESGVTILFNIVDSYEQVGSKTLFNPVFIVLHQPERFYACSF